MCAVRWFVFATVVDTAEGLEEGRVPMKRGTMGSPVTDTPIATL